MHLPCHRAGGRESELERVADVDRAEACTGMRLLRGHSTTSLPTEHSSTRGVDAAAGRIDHHPFVLGKA